MRMENKKQGEFRGPGLPQGTGGQHNQAFGSGKNPQVQLKRTLLSALPGVRARFPWHGT